MFISFFNFDWCFIQTFSRIAILVTLILKITELFKKLVLKKFKTNNKKIVGNGDSKINEMVIDLS